MISEIQTTVRQPKTHVHHDESSAYREEIKPMPTVVYFRGDMVEFMTDEVWQFMNDDMPCKYKLCDNWNTLHSSLMLKPQAVIVHHDMIKEHGGTAAEFVMMFETLVKYLNFDKKPVLGINIEIATPKAAIKELQKNGIHGIVPSCADFGKEEARTSIKALISGIPYWPKHVIDKLDDGRNKNKNRQDEIYLTPRQREIFDLICQRGISNKQIAKILKISESTVKIHVSAIMKAYCVRNRTQLALSVKK